MAGLWEMQKRLRACQPSRKQDVRSDKCLRRDVRAYSSTRECLPRCIILVVVSLPSGHTVISGKKESFLRPPIALAYGNQGHQEHTVLMN